MLELEKQMKSLEKQMDVLTDDDIFSSHTDSGDSEDDEACGQVKSDKKCPRSKRRKSSQNVMSKFVNRLKIQPLGATKIYWMI